LRRELLASLLPELDCSAKALGAEAESADAPINVAVDFSMLGRDISSDKRTCFLLDHAVLMP
jgi:hypothetical protein